MYRQVAMYAVMATALITGCTSKVNAPTPHPPIDNPPVVRIAQVSNPSSGLADHLEASHSASGLEHKAINIHAVNLSAALVMDYGKTLLEQDAAFKAYNNLQWQYIRAGKFDFSQLSASESAQLAALELRWRESVARSEGFNQARQICESRKK